MADSIRGLSPQAGPTAVSIVRMQAEVALERVAPGSGEGEVGAGAEDQVGVAVRGGVELGDAVELDEGGSVNAAETFGVELLFERGQRFAQQVLAGADVQGDVVVRGFHPI